MGNKYNFIISWKQIGCIRQGPETPANGQKEAVPKRNRFFEDAYLNRLRIQSSTLYLEKIETRIRDTVDMILMRMSRDGRIR